MLSFFMRCKIFLLLVLTGNSTVAYLKNDSYQWMTPAKVFTSYLKVPWINLNSLWKDNVSSVCRDDITTLFESADAGEMWALQMLDAASKIPAGIFTGNIRDLGMYEECVRVKADRNPANIQGRHCMVSMSMPPKVVGDASEVLYVQKLSGYNPTPNVRLNFAASVCLPSSCGVEDIAGFVNASIQSTLELVEFGVEVAKVTCSSVKATTESFTLGTKLAISFFAIIAFLLISCTVCDFVVEARSDEAPLALKTLAKFSLYTNASKLLSTEIPSGSISAIHGIKFFSIFLVVMMHRLMSILVKPLVNLSSLYDLRYSWLAPFMVISPLAVDSFLVVSGFLIAYLLLDRMRSGGKLNVLELYLHRYLRLAPCIIALLLCSIFIFPTFGSGPIWEIGLQVSQSFCRKNWWTNILYIQNFVNQEEMCMPHTWYSAVEMQLFWICPILLYPLHYRPKLGLVISSLLLIASLIVPAVHLVVNQYSSLVNMNKIIEIQYKEAVNSYSMTYNRALPYFVGILLGYYAVNNKRKLSKVQVAFNWILTCIFMLICYWKSSSLQPIAIDYNVAWEAAFVSFGRLGWSLTIAWIIYACTYGYGGPVTKILSLPIFVPLSRLSYGIYLISPILQFGLNATEQTAEFYSPLKVLYLVLSDLMISIAGAIILNLCFESPVIVLEKIMRTKCPSEIIKHPSTTKKEKLVAIIEDYPYSVNGRVGSDLATDPRVQHTTRMLQPDFWRTVSEVLKTVGKNPTKTPAEWVKTWQDWKSNIVKNDRQLKTHANDIQNGSTKLETGITTLEKELLIFLAAVSWGSDDATSSKEAADIGDPEKSNPDTCGPQNEGFVRKLVGTTSAENAYPNKNIDKLSCKCNNAI